MPQQRLCVFDLTMSLEVCRALSGAPDNAHARRHVYQARETDPARMGAVLAYIGQLYAVEKRARKAGLQADELRQLRQEVSRPIANQLHAYLLSIQSLLLPKSDAGQAVAYLLKNWQALTRYLEDGDLAIDNNRTERSLRGIANGVHCASPFQVSENIQV